MSEEIVYVSFDIDGTIVAKGQALSEHRMAFVKAISELFAPCDIPSVFLGHSVNGWMDQNIITEMIEKCGFPATPENVAKGVTKTEDVYIEIAKTTPIILPGVRDLLKKLTSMPNVAVGIASGNLPRLCWHKLGLADIADLFPGRIGGYGTSKSRAHAILNGKEEAERQTGKKVKRVIHIGDTTNDVSAGHEAGGVSVAVLTGITPAEDLAEADLIVENLESGMEKILDLVQM